MGLECDPVTDIVWRTRARNIAVSRSGFPDDSGMKHDEIRKWMSHYLIKFRDIFDPRMKKIIAELEHD